MSKAYDATYDLTPQMIYSNISLTNCQSRCYNLKQTKSRKPQLKLSSLCKSNTVIAHVKFSVVSPNEDISQNPEWTIGWWDVNSHES